MVDGLTAFSLQVAILLPAMRCWRIVRMTMFQQQQQQRRRRRRWRRQQQRWQRTQLAEEG